MIVRLSIPIKKTLDDDFYINQNHELHALIIA